MVAKTEIAENNAMLLKYKLFLTPNLQKQLEEALDLACFCKFPGVENSCTLYSKVMCEGIRGNWLITQNWLLVELM